MTMRVGQGFDVHRFADPASGRQISPAITTTEGLASRSLGESGKAFAA